MLTLLERIVISDSSKYLQQRLQSFSHGTNDAQKSMGIITLALIVANIQDPTNVEPALWVKVACATAMGLGTAIGGWKIIKTVGGNIMKIRPAMVPPLTYHQH